MGYQPLINGKQVGLLERLGFVTTKEIEAPVGIAQGWHRLGIVIED